MSIISTSELPELYQVHMRKRKNRKLMGANVGTTCVDGSKLGNEHAHAHISGRGYRAKYKGWICFRPKHWENESTRIHELAHILTGEGHTIRWRAKFVELGGNPADDWSYQRWELAKRRALHAFDDNAAPGLAELLVLR